MDMLDFHFTRLSKGYIQLRLNFKFADKSRFVYSIGVKVEKQYWQDGTIKIPRKTKLKVADRSKLIQQSNRLTKVKSAFTSLLKRYDANGINLRKKTTKEITNDLKVLLNENSIPQKIENYTFLEYFDKYLLDNPNFSKATIKVVKCTKSVLQDFCTYSFNERSQTFRKITTPKKLSFNEIDNNFLSTFNKYLLDVRAIESPNTSAKYIKYIKIVMKAAQKNDLHTNMKYQDFKYSTFNKTEYVFLTKAELKKLYDLDLTNNQKLDRVRDLFLLAAFTGLRYSDMDKFKKESIDFESEILRVYTSKASKFVDVLLNDVCFEILEKYNYNIKRISNQKMNQYIKEVAQLAGIENDVVLNEQFKEVPTKQGKKYEFISCHTARRSFAENLRIAGYLIQDISDLLGHSSIEVTRKYLRITTKQTAKRLSKDKYFKNAFGSNLKAI